eukprot:445349_1
MSAPVLKDLPSSPFKGGKFRGSTKAPSTLRALFQNKHVLNSMKWGFVVGSFVTFHTLYHSRGNIVISLFFGGVAFCVVSPIKYWVYMRRQRWEFFRSLQFTAKQNTTILGTGKTGKKIHSRELLYDPNEPYSADEWAFAQRIYRKMFYYGIGGGAVGLVSAISVLTLMNASKVSPMWMRFGFCLFTGAFGASMGLRMNLDWAIKEASKWEHEGRLKQEVKYVLNWMNADKIEEQNRPDPSKGIGIKGQRI